MSNLRQTILAAPALTPIVFAMPANAALDSSLRGSLAASSEVDIPTAHRVKHANLAIRSLEFAAPREQAPSTMYLAATSTSTGYNKTAKQIAASMGYIGTANGAGTIIGIIDTGIDLKQQQFLSATGASRILKGTCLPRYSTTLCLSPTHKIGRHT